MTKYLIVITMLLVTGCTSVATANRPNDYYRPSSSDTDSEPLFGSTGGSLADSDIERILNYRLKLPKQNRIAILRLSSQSYWRNYSNDFTQLNESISQNFIGQLRESSRVYDASFLPSMLVPEQRTVPYLREAAARYQADLLLAYRSNCRTFEKYKFIDPNETKAYCSVEVVLLDVRSGIVPFTVVSSNEFSARKELGDKNFSETIKKAEMAAVAKSLNDSAYQLNLFLANTGTL
ncbi:hypothetical protein [Microbulbifer agarilyticus]|uniref:hypothetical protein n=1 Tax=Microbulbifer agarilyticus TaxID=260552 RepID=UPI001CD32CA7|nr:hypothetical protein [Microbulbifer agarilyticus]MCA0895137.1 hypothetical protein [Microbulbifer agarilyticus]